MEPCPSFENALNRGEQRRHGSRGREPRGRGGDAAAATVVVAATIVVSGVAERFAMSLCLLLFLSTCAAAARSPL